MKNSAKQFTKQYIQDCKQFINGNVAEHLILTANSEERGFFSYLTDDEIEEYENDNTRRSEIEEEVESFINDNFDIDIEEFDYNNF